MYLQPNDKDSEVIVSLKIVHLELLERMKLKLKLPSSKSIQNNKQRAGIFTYCTNSYGFTWLVSPLQLYLLLLLCGMGVVEGLEPVPDCTYPVNPSTGWDARTCGIRQAVDAYLDTTTQAATTTKYGTIENWDVLLFILV